MKACDIPTNSTVTKPKGKTKYKLLSSFYIYGGGVTPAVPELKADVGMRFLISLENPTSINCISDQTELNVVT